MAKVFILCAGGSSKWGYYLGIPKPLIQINKEPLLHRTLRLLKGHKISDVTIVATDPILEQKGYSFFKPEASRWFVETVLSTESLWQEQNIFLMGDVFYTQEAIKTIVASADKLKFFGRPGKSMYSHKAHGEVFGITFSNEASQQVKAHGEKVIQAAKSLGHGKAWQLYRSLAGFGLDEKQVETAYFQVIDDFTDDFDTPEEYDLAIFRYNFVASRNPIKQLLLWIWVRVLDPISIKLFDKPIYA
ncbi:hypothetical protein Ctha_1254 [Chloroherpeton thalassium ATCC 35110]|uniref:MobA-like NTP transferase domain-containing protein n=1 Tax=Chloroherpeton thalassium (strain ATCC 35110 / GB-78) TaxID=517418 RepID=B3QZ24_CHLT3|nr:NTP transferase domain-containing protein [Chloroherpeton thalassium]ACF13717.1 hypothetical protein Ctha_1254 [Chloroherpeton thalassium ATCC 35110]